LPQNTNDEATDGTIIGSPLQPSRWALSIPYRGHAHWPIRRRSRRSHPWAHHIVEDDRYPFSPRIRNLRAILAKLRPGPALEPLPSPEYYEPPRAKGRR